MRDRLTDEMLAKAAKQVAEAMKASLPNPDECHHEFSPTFEQKMRRLILQTERRRHIHKCFQSVAVACLAVVISLSMWLAIDTEARATLIQWIKTVYENSVVYEFFRSGERQAETNYRLGWVPEGYTLETVVSGEVVTTIIYQGNMDIIYFTYEHPENGAQTELFPGDSNVEAIQVNGMQGEFYLAQNPSESNSIVWFDERSNILLSISGFIDKETMIQIAENVETISLSD